MSVEIIPAILPKSLKDLTSHLERLRGVSRKVQIDIYEGGFLGRGKTWPLRDRRGFREIVENEEKGLPYWTEFDIEMDLMLREPKELALSFVRLRTARIIVHASYPGALQTAQILADYDEDDRPFPIGVGVAVGLNDPLDVLEPFEHIMDFVQIMGIAKIGAQGWPFDPRALTVLERLRRRYPQLELQVDGGVTLKNARALSKAGANRLIVGSAIFGAADAEAAVKALYTEANGG